MTIERPSRGGESAALVDARDRMEQVCAMAARRLLGHYEATEEEPSIIVDSLIIATLEPAIARLTQLTAEGD